MIGQDESPKRVNWERQPRPLKGVLLIFLILVLLASGIWFFVTRATRFEDVGNLSDVVQGASALALFLFSFLVSVLALFGWRNLKDEIGEMVEQKTRVRLDRLEKEMRGRVLSALGQMFGEMSSRADALDPIDRDRLTEAVALCEKGFKFLNEAGEIPSVVGLNNYVYYKALMGDAASGPSLLSHANELLALGKKYDWIPYLLTYCRVVLIYSSSTDERTTAEKMAEGIVKGGERVTSYQRKEASFYLASFQASRQANTSTLK